MKQRKVGRSGLQVSEIGFGCNALGGRIDLEGSRKVVAAALDAGITLFDTADVYGASHGVPCGSEICLGQILGDRRKEIILATKFGNERMHYDAAGTSGSSRRAIMMAVEGSLRRLKTDWIDLYQVHKPDRLTPIEETLRALDDLIRQGKVRYIGCSNFAAWQVVDAHWTARLCNLNAFVCCENEYSVLVRNAERELLPAMQAHGLGLLPYFPLAAGLLTGKYKRGVPFPEDARLAHSKRWASRFLTEANWTRLESLERFCTTRGHTLLQVAFAWLLKQPTVASVIAGATKPEQLKANIDAAQAALAAEDVEEINRITSAS